MGSIPENEQKEKGHYFSVNIYSELPLTYYGGGERLIVMIHNYLKSHYINVKVIDNCAYEPEKRVERRVIEELLGGDYVSIPFRRNGFPRFLYQAFPDVGLLTEPSNVTTLIFTRRIPPSSVLKALAQSGNKFIFCLHGIALEKFRIAPIKIMVHQIVMRLQLKTFSRFAHGNIYAQALTPTIADYLVKNGARGGNVFVVENEFDIGLSNIKENKEYFQVVYVGRMQGTIKGIKLLRKIVSIVKDMEPSIRFVIIGKGPDLNMLKRISDKAEVLDDADDLLKKKVIEDSSLAIITSNLEPSSLVAQEFLNGGLPIVTTPASGPSYIVSKNEAFGKISSFNPGRFADDIMRYYYLWRSNKEEYFNLRIGIARNFTSLFHTEHMLESYLNMILQISSPKSQHVKDRRDSNLL